uniref:Uncharacterized protein n=1 Tax=Rhizophora mucronata TaxID=61149 RepID=A0A2P2PMR5_RHIMU
MEVGETCVPHKKNLQKARMALPPK